MATHLRRRAQQAQAWTRAERMAYHQLRAEQALRFLEPDSAVVHLMAGKALLDETASLAAWQGRYLGAMGRLSAQQGNYGAAEALLIEALAWWQQQPTPGLGLIEAHLDLADVWRQDLAIDRALDGVWTARRLMQTLFPEGEYASPAVQRTAARIDLTLAAIFTRIGRTVVHEQVTGLSTLASRDSASHYLARAQATWPRTDTLGRAQTGVVAGEYALYYQGGGTAFWAAIDTLEAIAATYPGRVVAAAIDAAKLRSGYHLAFTGDTEAGLVATRRALALQRQVFGSAHPALVPMSYMAVAHPFRASFEGNRVKDGIGPAVFDTYLDSLLLMTQRLAPGWQASRLDPLPPASAITNRDYYLKVLDMRVKCAYWRAKLTEAPADHALTWRLVEGFLALIGDELRQNPHVYRLENTLQVAEMTLTLALGIAYERYQETGAPIYWETALAVMECNRALLLRKRQLVQRLYIAPDTAGLQAWTMPALRQQFTAPDQGLVSLFRYPGFQTFALVLTADTAAFLDIKDVWGTADSVHVCLTDQWLATLWGRLQPPGEGPADSLAQAAHRVYTHLWQPIVEVAGGLPPRLLVIPGPQLEALPLSLLLDSLPAAGTPFAQWPYLGRHHAFSYAYSLESLHLQAARPVRAQGPWLGVAPAFGPADSQAFAFRGDRFAPRPLVYHEGEVKAIAAMHPQADLLLGPAATKVAVREALGRYAYLHLATHAWVHSQRPDSSFVAFSNLGAGGEDFRLSLAEVYDLDIPAQLLVMSGCATAQGPLQPGEGLASLSRAFFAAGVRSVVASLWPVHDGATAHLMPTFYDGLAAGLPKDQAIQAAQQAFLQTANPRWHHPAYWGAFQVYGDVAPVPFGQGDGWRWGWLLLALALGLVAWAAWRRLS